MTSESEPKQALWPIRARWKQAVDDGTVTWHLDELREDGRFRGAVHYRTRGRTENRTISGHFDKETLDCVGQLIAQLDQMSQDDGVPRLLDELLGVGKGAEFRRLVGLVDSVAISNDTEAVRMFKAFVALIQPVMETRADLLFGRDV